MLVENTHYSLLNHNTFGIDVKASVFLEYDSLEDLRNILTHKQNYPFPFLHIGAGSNLLFLSDYKGTILHSAIKGIKVIKEEDDDLLVKVGAGVVWDDFVAFCVDHNLGGVENLSLIPGEVGSSVVQNIGAYGVEVKDVVENVEALDVDTSETHIFTNQECRFSYRSSIFKHELKGKYIVTHVIYRLAKKPVFNLQYGNIKTELEKYDVINLSTIREAIIHIREMKLPDPKIEGNAGSFFMNPIIAKKQYLELIQHYTDMPYYEVDEERVKVPAAWLIDCCGWKGRVSGKAGVHSKQALVLVNKGGAQGTDIVSLAHEIQKSVEEKFGIHITPEVNFIGESV